MASVAWRTLIPILILLVVGGSYAQGQLGAGGERGSAGEAPNGVSNGTVARVVDGDTVRVRIDGGRAEPVRLIGVDTPESVKPNTPVECFAKAASAFAKRLLPRGERVRLRSDVEPRDRYGRRLAYVTRVRGAVFVNAELARRGYAVPLTIPPNVRFSERFAALAREARQARRGLWGAC